MNPLQPLMAASFNAHGPGHFALSLLFAPEDAVLAVWLLEEIEKFRF